MPSQQQILASYLAGLGLPVPLDGISEEQAFAFIDRYLAARDLSILPLDEAIESSSEIVQLSGFIERYMQSRRLAVVSDRPQREGF